MSKAARSGRPIRRRIALLSFATPATSARNGLFLLQTGSPSTPRDWLERRSPTLSTRDTISPLTSFGVEAMGATNQAAGTPLLVTPQTRRLGATVVAITGATSTHGIGSLPRRGPSYRLLKQSVGALVAHLRPGQTLTRTGTDRLLAIAHQARQLRAPGACFTLISCQIGRSTR